MSFDPSISGNGPVFRKEIVLLFVRYLIESFNADWEVRTLFLYRYVMTLAHLNSHWTNV